MLNYVDKVIQDANKISDPNDTTTVNFQSLECFKVTVKNVPYFPSAFADEETLVSHMIYLKIVCIFFYNYNCYLYEWIAIRST